MAVNGVAFSGLLAGLLMLLDGGAGMAGDLAERGSGTPRLRAASPSFIVRQQLEAIDDVRVADLHVWELGPGRRSCIVSVVTARPREVSAYRHAVLSALDVAHLTIEIHQCGRSHGPGGSGDAAALDDVAHRHDH